MPDPDDDHPGFPNGAPLPEGLEVRVCPPVVELPRPTPDLQSTGFYDPVGDDPAKQRIPPPTMTETERADWRATSELRYLENVLAMNRFKLELQKDLCDQELHDNQYFHDSLANQEKELLQYRTQIVNIQFARKEIPQNARQLAKSEERQIFNNRSGNVPKTNRSQLPFGKLPGPT